MDSLANARSLYQGILWIVVSFIDILVFAAYVAEGNVPLAAMFGVVTPLGFALGVWLIRRALIDERTKQADPESAARRIDA